MLNWFRRFYYLHLGPRPRVCYSVRFVSSSPPEKWTRGRHTDAQTINWNKDYKGLTEVEGVVWENRGETNANPAA